MWNNGFDHQAMKDNDFLRAGKQMRWAKTCTNLQDHRQGQTTQVQPGRTPELRRCSWEVGRVRAAGAHRQNNRKERALLRGCLRNVHRAPLRSSPVHWPGHLCGEATRSRQWPLPRELEYRIPGVHPELGIICVPSKQSRKTHNSRGRR